MECVSGGVLSDGLADFGHNLVSTEDWAAGFRVSGSVSQINSCLLRVRMFQSDEDC